MKHGDRDDKRKQGRKTRTSETMSENKCLPK